MEALVVMPVRRSGNGVGQSPESHKDKVHREAGPYQEARFAESPHLANAVVNDVSHGKDQQSARNVYRSDGYLLCLEHVCRYQADAKEYAEKHKQHTHLFVFCLHFLVF